MSAKRSAPSEQTEESDLIDRAANTLHESVDRLADGARHADGTVRDRARLAEESLASAVTDAREQSEELLTQATTFVKANPLLSLGLAMLAGALLDRKLRD